MSNLLLSFQKDKKTNRKSDMSYSTTRKNENFMEFQKKRKFAEIENSGTIPSILNNNRNFDNFSNIKLSLPNKSASNYSANLQDRAKIYKDVNPLKIIENEKNEAFDNLDKFLYLDEKFTEFDKINPSIQTINFKQNKKKEYVTIKNSPFPKELQTKYKKSLDLKDPINVLSGVYERLDLTYFVFDKEIYLWNNYTNEIFSYTSVPNIITCIHICKPKHNIFSDEIQDIIVTCTRNEVIILLIKIENNRIEILPSEYIIELDSNYIITSIASSIQRRVFLGSQNDYIIELEYSSVPYYLGFGKKIKSVYCSKEGIINKLVPSFIPLLKYHSYITKIVIDNTRHILYALKHYLKNPEQIFDFNNVINSEIMVFDLGTNGNELRKKVGTIKQEEIKGNYLYSSNYKNPRNYIIIDIQFLSRADSKNNHLICITYSGLRAYVKFNMTEDFTHKPELGYYQSYPFRVTKEFQILVKPFSDNSKSMNCEIQEESNKDQFLAYDKFFIHGKKIFSFTIDPFNSKTLLDVIESDQSIGVKTNLGNNHNQFKINENITNLFSFYKEKRIFSICKLDDNENLDMKRLMRFVPDENYHLKKFYSNSRPIYYQDSIEHFSPCSMLIYSVQQFLNIEKYYILTSSELILLGKLRPIDILYDILINNLNNDKKLWEELSAFIDEHSIYETCYMVLTIICNKDFKFFTFDAQLNTIKENTNEKNISSISVDIFLKLISYKINSPMGFDPSDNSQFYIGQAIIEKKLIVNQISYSLFMYLARVSRLIWEEYIYLSDKVNFIIESLKIKNLQRISNIIEEFTGSIQNLQDQIMMKTNDYYNKSKAKESSEEFLAFKKDIEYILFLSGLIIETINFIQLMYGVTNIKRYFNQIHPETLDSILKVKIKDIIRNPNQAIVKIWIEEFFELVFNSRNLQEIQAKLDEITLKCPNILPDKDKNVVFAYILMKAAKNESDEFNRNNLLNQSFNFLIHSPEIIRLDKVGPILCSMGEILTFIKLACCRSEYYLTGSTSFLLENKENEVKKQVKFGPINEIEAKNSLYFIFKILDEISNCLINNDQSIRSDFQIEEFTVFLRKLNLENKIKLYKSLQNEILNVNVELVHVMLFDHLYCNNQIELIVELQSPFIESYLDMKFNQNSNSLKLLVIIYKYFTSEKVKNYDKAYKTILNLINYNNFDHQDENETMKICDRKVYCDWGIKCLQNIINSNQEINPELEKTKKSAIDFRELVIIQNNIFEILLKKKEEFYDIENFNKDLMECDLQIKHMNQLFMIAKKYGLYEIGFDILFISFKKEISFEKINKKNIMNMYADYFELLFKNEYPTNMFPVLEKIFLRSIELNDFNKFFPLDDAVMKIEELNFKYFTTNSMHFSMFSKENLMNLTYDSKIKNPFWLVLILNSKLNLGFDKIYNIYSLIFDKISNSKRKRYYEEIYSLFVLLGVINLCILKDSGLKSRKSINYDKKTEKREFKTHEMRGFLEKTLNLIHELMICCEPDIIDLLRKVIHETLEKLKKIDEETNIDMKENIHTNNEKNQTIHKDFFNKNPGRLNKFETVNLPNRSSSTDMYRLDSIIDPSKSFFNLIKKASNNEIHTINKNKI